MAASEVVESITQILNPRTGENFSPLEAQRILRADMKRRDREARRLQRWYALRNGK